MTSSTYSKGGTKLLKGGTKLLKGGTKLLKGGTKLLKGGTKLLKGGTKLLKGGTKLLKGGTKLLKGGTKSLGWATGGGSYDPPDPPLATGLIDVYLKKTYHSRDKGSSFGFSLVPDGRRLFVLTDQQSNLMTRTTKCHLGNCPKIRQGNRGLLQYRSISQVSNSH